MKSLLALLLLVALGATTGSAQEDLDEILEGFDEEESAPGDAEAPGEPDDAASFWDLRGTLSLGASSNYAQNSPPPGAADYRGLSRLRAELWLQLDLELPRDWKGRVSGRGFRDYAYAIKGRSDFTDEVLDLYEKEVEFQEIYLQGRLRDDLDLKVGRQIVVWGRSDNLRVLDVLNPLDNREPGLVDIEDLRLPVAMTRLDYYRGSWSATAIAIHESRGNDDPVFGSDFFPFPTRPPGESRPANGGDDTEYALALGGIFSGWDVSFHWARFFEDRAHLELVGMGPAAIQRHSRLTLWGAGANLARGNWLLKGEAARLSGLEFFARPGREKARSDILLGVEYAGFDEQMLALEAALRHLHGFDSALEGLPDAAQRNAVEIALRYTGNFRHDTVHLTGLALVFGERGQDGSVLRLSVDYDLRDAVTLGAGVLIFEDGDLPAFAGIDHNDRVFVSARYSF